VIGPPEQAGAGPAHRPFWSDPVLTSRQGYSMVFHLLNMAEENTAAQQRRAKEATEGVTAESGLWGHGLQHLREQGLEARSIGRIGALLRVGGGYRTGRRRTRPARTSCAAARPNPVVACAPSSVRPSPLPHALGSPLVASALPPLGEPSRTRRGRRETLGSGPSGPSRVRKPPPHPGHAQPLHALPG